MSALLNKIEDGHTDLVFDLVSKGKRNLTSTCHSRTRGETPLHRAAAFGSSDVIGALVKAGGEIQVTDAFGETQPAGRAGIDEVAIYSVCSVASLNN